MKKLISFLIIIGLCAATTFAQGSSPSQDSGDSRFRVSLGGGGFVAGNFSSWVVDEALPGDLNRYNETQLSVGPYIFADFKYIELSIGLLLGQLNADKIMSDNPNFPAQTLGLRGSAYLKLPFTLSPMFSIFPLLGAEYDLYLHSHKTDGRDAKFPISATNQEASATDALNTIWFKTGIGLDTFFNDHLFLRTQIFYGIRLPNNMERYLNDTRPDVEWMLEHGGDFKIAIGYRF